MCGVRGVSGRPATISLCLGVTATLPASASRCLGVEGVRAGFSGEAKTGFAGEFSFALESGSRDPGAPCFAGVVPLFPRLTLGFSSAVAASTSIASPLCTFFFCGVTNGFSFSASSRMTNCALRFERVETSEFASASALETCYSRNDDRNVSRSYLVCWWNCEFSFQER